MPTPRKPPGSKRRPSDVGNLSPEMLARVSVRESMENEAFRLMSVECRSLAYISKKLEIGYSTAHSYIARAAKRSSVEKTEERRAIAVARLEKAAERMNEMIESYMPAALGGNVDSVEVVVKCTAQILAALEKDVKISGLAAPEKVEMTGKDGGPVTICTPADARRVMAELFGGHVQPPESAPTGAPDSDPPVEGTTRG